MKSKKKLPKTVNIGGLEFKIRYPVIMPKDAIGEMGNDVVGFCDSSNREIAVLQKWALKDDTVIVHEIVHAIINYMGLKGSIQKELPVRVFSQMLYGALKSIKMIK